MEPNIAGLQDRETWLLAVLLNQHFDVDNLSYIFLDLNPTRIERLRRYFDNNSPNLVWNLSTELLENDKDIQHLQNPVIARIFRRKGGVEKLYKLFQETGRNPYNIPFNKNWKE